MSFFTLFTRNTALTVFVFVAAIAVTKAQISDIRSVVPPSPNVASILKFNEIPVSKYAGLPETSIPVYTIQSNNVQIPINLLYHSGGVRLTEAASWVGMGWDGL